MIPIIGYHESLADFPTESVEMRPPCTEELHGKLVQHFGLGAIECLGRGFNNDHHGLGESADSLSLVVRRSLFPVPALERRLKREYRVLRHLRYFCYPHAPRPAGRVPPDVVDGAPAFAMSFVGGSNPGFSLEAVGKLGEAVAQLHRVTPPGWLAKLGTAPTPILLEMAANWLPKFFSLEASFPASVRSELAALLEAIPRQVAGIGWGAWSPALLHGDLGDHNFLMDIGGDVVLLDWEFASVSHPLLDLMWLFNRNGFGGAQRSAFWSGYGDPPVEWERLLPLLTAMCLVEDAIWAQSGLNDMRDGRNGHFFQPGERAFLEEQVARALDVRLDR